MTAVLAIKDMAAGQFRLDIDDMHAVLTDYIVFHPRPKAVLRRDKADRRKDKLSLF